MGGIDIGGASGALATHADDLTQHSSGQRLGRLTHSTQIVVTATTFGTLMPSLNTLTPADSGGRPVTISVRLPRIIPDNATQVMNVKILRDGVDLRYWQQSAFAASSTHNLPAFEVDTDPVDGTDVFTIEAWRQTAGTQFTINPSATNLAEFCAYAR